MNKFSANLRNWKSNFLVSWFEAQLHVVLLITEQNHAEFN